LVDFAMERPVAAVIVTYLNRLSDWLFVMARLANRREGRADMIWEK
jgi:cob(I)alamin adenosyltransferase